MWSKVVITSNQKAYAVWSFVVALNAELHFVAQIPHQRTKTECRIIEIPVNNCKEIMFCSMKIKA